MTLFLTDTEREQLRADLAKAERLAREHAAILAGCRAALADTPVDPLAEYRLPSGAIGHVEESARWVQRGDWIQAVHGDADRWRLSVPQRPTVG